MLAWSSTSSRRPFTPSILINPQESRAKQEGQVLWPVLWVKQQAQTFSYRLSIWHSQASSLLPPFSAHTPNPPTASPFCSRLCPGSQRCRGGLSHRVLSGWLIRPQFSGQLHLLLEHADPSHRPLPSTGAGLSDSCGYLLTRTDRMKKVVFFQVCSLSSEPGIPEAI